MKTVAIIGFGRFGQLLAKIFLESTNYEILVISSKRFPDESRLTFTDWQGLYRADIVIPAVPISAFEETLQRISRFIHPQAVCMDVCSVKLFPVDIMQRYLPNSVSIIACHPMFGPVSFKKNNGLRGLRVVLHPIRVSRSVYAEISEFWRNLGLQIAEIDPEAHDKFAAQTQMYTFLIGKLTNLLNLDSTPIDTYWYSFFLEQANSVRDDGDTLFTDMLRYNRFSLNFIQEYESANHSIIERSRQIIFSSTNEI